MILTGLPSLVALSEARRWLKAYDCNFEKAVNAYFDNGGVLKAQVYTGLPFRMSFPTEAFELGYHKRLG